MATGGRSLARKARTAVAGLGTSTRACREALRIPDLRRVELAFVGFNTAEWAVYIAVAVYAYGQSGARVGELFYVIETGDADVTQGGRPLRSLSAGDSFGEIALLRAVPRTATVTARTPMTLLALGRAPFLEAVTRYAPGVVAANEIVGSRLATPQR